MFKIIFYGLYESFFHRKIAKPKIKFSELKLKFMLLDNVSLLRSLETVATE